jgi:broad specificity phosphatase PhoE
VVAHGGTLQCLYHAALGLPPTTHATFAFADTCVHEWEIDESGRVIIRLANCTRHLLGLAATM